MYIFFCITTNSLIFSSTIISCIFNPEMFSSSLFSDSEKGGKTSLCGPENRRWMCESMRPTLGTSLIVFAVPLLLPGITLTAVGFDDNSSFAKYGALHIIGLTLLSLSGLLLLTGTFLNIRFHDKVSYQ